MDIIEIDSLEEDSDIDDIDWPESPDRSSAVSNITTAQWRNNSESFSDRSPGSQMNFQAHPGFNDNKVSHAESSTKIVTSLSGVSNAPQFHGHGELTQKRTLPSSFQSVNSKSSSEHGTRYHGGPSLSQQKEQVMPNDVSGVNHAE